MVQEASRMRGSAEGAHSRRRSCPTSPVRAGAASSSLSLLRGRWGQAVGQPLDDDVPLRDDELLDEIALMTALMIHVQPHSEPLSEEAVDRALGL